MLPDVLILCLHTLELLPVVDGLMHGDVSGYSP